ncbi:MAG: helix-turn-helix transcriptional regulator [Oceanicaulis sp.]|uniref:helix-turn-helix domain-containing protein n=1 Tax=Glycocaulis sp. TaxID=1969725 RepID=UPI0025B94EC8|nr:helix-turn-helix transcriptional regulator [Glycocaulis sp.]MCC5981896.1 helix-turn-helix transcriptional regulator [Oceanicaulis sp.]MCH8522048.1 helix-turn-helix domain-containing protein [Glycocaulis sp.]
MTEGNGRGLEGKSAKWGRALRALRLRSNMKQDDAARRLQVSQSYVSRLENGVITPSPEIAARLASLIHTPAHRPLIDQLKSVVLHSPHAVALLSCTDRVVQVEAASQRFRDAGPPFDRYFDGLAVNDPLGQTVAGLVCRAVQAGAFDGEIACIEFVWTAEVSAARRYFHSVQTPIFSGTEWLVHSATALLRAEAYDRFVEENGGPERVHHF